MTITEIKTHWSLLLDFNLQGSAPIFWVTPVGCAGEVGQLPSRKGSHCRASYGFLCPVTCICFSIPLVLLRLGPLSLWSLFILWFDTSNSLVVAFSLQMHLMPRLLNHHILIHNTKLPFFKCLLLWYMCAVFQNPKFGISLLFFISLSLLSFSHSSFLIASYLSVFIIETLVTINVTISNIKLNYWDTLIYHW